MQERLLDGTILVDTTGGDSFAGIALSTDWSFTADGTAPALDSLAGQLPATLVALVQDEAEDVALTPAPPPEEQAAAPDEEAA